MIDNIPPTSATSHIRAWVDRGDCVVLHDNTSLKSVRIYHQCIPTRHLEARTQPIVFRYVDCALNPMYLQILEEIGYTPCVCTLQNIVLDPTSSANGCEFEQYAITPRCNQEEGHREDPLSALSTAEEESRC